MNEDYRYAGNEYSNPEAPVVGDEIEIYDDEEKSIRLKVVSRLWIEEALIIELHLGCAWNQKGITEFEKWVKS